MNFAVDNRISTPKPAPDTSQRLEEIADMMLTRAFLGAEPVDSTNISKRLLTKQIEEDRSAPEMTEF